MSDSMSSTQKQKPKKVQFEEDSTSNTNNNTNTKYSKTNPKALTKKRLPDATKTFQLNPFELFLICQSNIDVIQGPNVHEPINIDRGFYVGDVIAGKLKNSENKKYIRLRNSSKVLNTRQYIHQHTTQPIFIPNLCIFDHISIGTNSYKKCIEITKCLINAIDSALTTTNGICTTYANYDRNIAHFIMTYVPFYYPIFSVCSTIFRGHGYHTQFSVPFFHARVEFIEYLHRCSRLHQRTLQKLKKNKCDMSLYDEEYLYEKKLYIAQEKRMKNEFKNRNFHHAMHGRNLEIDIVQNDEYSVSESTQGSDLSSSSDSESLESYEIRMKSDLESIVNSKLKSSKSLPKWIQNIYRAIHSKTSFYYNLELYFIRNKFCIGLKDHEFLEQNNEQYMKYEIDDKFFSEYRPILVAKKYGTNISKLIVANKIQGKLWFDCTFDEHQRNCEIVDHKFGSFFRCKIGGKWEAGISRHFIHVENERKQIFREFIHVIILNLVL